MSLLNAGARTLAVGAMLLAAVTASGQDYPNKPVRIIVSAPGGGSDFMARQISQGISGPLGQPVIVEYRGSGILSAEFASKAPPDGYTLLISGAIIWIYPLLRKAPYDVVTDFSPITMISTEPSIFAVHPSVPVKSVKELIALAKSRPGDFNYGSGSGFGSTSHLATELFRHLSGINIIHVPYKGNSLAVTALLSGELQMLILDTGLLLPHAKSGRLKALAVTSATTSPLAAGLPTIASTVPGYESVGRTGIWAPAKTPAAIINRLNLEMVRVLNSAESKERFFNAGMDVVSSSPDQFAAKIKSEIAILGKLIKDANIKVE